MKINILDGGIIFEVNKIRGDYGQHTLKNNKEYIENLYEEYINLGSKFITTCNYCYTPLKLEDWKNLCEKSIDLIQKFRKNEVKVFGSLPPYFKSYYVEDIDNGFCDFYIQSHLSKSILM